MFSEWAAAGLLVTGKCKQQFLTMRKAARCGRAKMRIGVAWRCTSMAGPTQRWAPYFNSRARPRTWALQEAESERFVGGLLDQSRTFMAIDHNKTSLPGMPECFPPVWMVKLAELELTIA